MSIIKIEVTEDHLKLLNQLTFKVKDNHITSEFDYDGDKKESAFGHNNLYYEIDLILNGMPENVNFLDTEERVFSEEEKKAMDELWGGMDKVLEIVCRYGEVKVGLYKRKYHELVWKYIG